MTTPAALSIREVIQTNIAALAAQLEAGNSDALTQFLAMSAKFHHYSFGNQLAIAVQCPDATRVAGFHTWRGMGRNVRKGEKAIRILAPMVAGKKRKDDAAGDDSRTPGQVFGYRAVCVFDIAQTDGEPLPSFAEAKGECASQLDLLMAFAASQGIAVAYSDNLGNAHGMSYGGRIELAKNHGEAETFTTLVHELAHELLHKGDARKDSTKESRELEAEAVSYVVGCHVGLDMTTTSADYIKLYKGDAKALAESMQAITRASSALIEALAAQPTEA